MFYSNLQVEFHQPVLNPEDLENVDAIYEDLYDEEEERAYESPLDNLGEDPSPEVVSSLLAYCLSATTYDDASLEVLQEAFPELDFHDSRGRYFPTFSHFVGPGGGWVTTYEMLRRGSSSGYQTHGEFLFWGPDSP